MLVCQIPHQNQHHQKYPLGPRHPALRPHPLFDPALPASATGVPDQVMSEGASGSSDAAVRLSMKRSSDSFQLRV